MKERVVHRVFARSASERRGTSAHPRAAHSTRAIRCRRARHDRVPDAHLLSRDWGCKAAALLLDEGRVNGNPHDDDPISSPAGL
jgi:hypothetical protein